MKRKNYDNSDGVIKEAIKVILGIIAIIICIVALTFGAGALQTGFKSVFGVRNANIDRQIFKENKSYVEGMVSDLAKYKYEYETTESSTGKGAIAELIRDKFSNFDKNNVESYSLQQFLIKTRGY